jgi:hypothetical protein
MFRSREAAAPAGAGAAAGSRRIRRRRVRGRRSRLLRWIGGILLALVLIATWTVILSTLLGGGR